MRASQHIRSSTLAVVNASTGANPNTALLLLPAEEMLCYFGFKLVAAELVFSGQQSEAGLGHERVRVALHRADGTFWGGWVCWGGGEAGDEGGERGARGRVHLQTSPNY